MNHVKLEVCHGESMPILQIMQFKDDVKTLYMHFYTYPFVDNHV